MSYKNITFLFFFISFCIDRSKPVKYTSWCRNRKTILPGCNLNRSRFILRRHHTACRKTFPYQLIQTELISCERFFDRSRSSADIRRTDRLMCILYFLSFRLLRLHRRNILFSVNRSDIFSCRCVRFVCDSSRIRTKISDDTDCSAAFNINTFIKLLRNAHRLLSSEIQSLRRFLLQCTRSKRKRSFSEPLARFYIWNFEFCILDLFDNLI